MNKLFKVLVISLLLIVTVACQYFHKSPPAKEPFPDLLSVNWTTIYPNGGPEYSMKFNKLNQPDGHYKMLLTNGMTGSLNLVVWDKATFNGEIIFDKSEQLKNGDTCKIEGHFGSDAHSIAGSWTCTAVDHSRGILMGFFNTKSDASHKSLQPDIR